ncbi:MAG: hypothetical protein PHG82_05170 [Candidatus Gracilibacteria bacterium]|nr:hypothetical protein [Candidatus Gracilibacteria bacterium]
MFETSILLLLKALIINIIIPIITGILFIYLFFGTKFRGIILYIISFFIGTGVIAFSLFNLQFIYFGIGILEYLLLNIFLLLALIIKIFYKKQNFGNYIQALKISYENINLNEINLSQKLVVIFGSIFVVISSIISFLYVANFPSYADDAFGNWHIPVLNIYEDSGVKIFGDKSEILGKGRLGYPIFIPIYKVIIADFFGGINDIYINLWQYLSFILFLIFVFYISIEKTKNPFYSILPLILILGLPLVFFHSVEGYLDLACAIYSVFSIYFLYLFLEKKDYDYLSMGLLFGFILSSIKNDGLVVYFAGIIIAFIIILVLKKEFKKIVLNSIKEKTMIIKSGFFALWFLIPFIAIKSYYGLGYNQAAGEAAGVGVSDKIHSEIFSMFSPIFLKMDNFNLALIFIAIIGYIVLKNIKKNIENNNLFIILSAVMIFLVLIAVFLFTENYLWVMNQTTVNRVFTMVFIILFAFTGFLLHEKKD